MTQANWSNAPTTSRFTLSHETERWLVGQVNDHPWYWLTHAMKGPKVGASISIQRFHERWLP